MNEIAMPRLSDSMEEGTILRWLVADGKQVERGDELAEIETDKASMVYEADAEGTLRIVAQEGATLPVGAPIAQLLAPGEEPDIGVPAADDGAAANDGAYDDDGAAAASAADDEAAAASTDDDGAAAGTSANDDRATAGVLAADDRATAGVLAADDRAAAGGDPERRVKASPLARRLATEAHLDIAAIQGSGPGGRVVKVDVERAASALASANGEPAQTSRPDAPAAAPREPARGDAATPALAKGEVQTIELTRTQELIARRMAEAKATIPEFTLQCEIDMEAAVRLRAELKPIAERRELPAPSFNDLVVRACALALREHPRANGSYRDGRFELHQRVNVGVAVAVEGALVVPVVRDADTLSIWEIAAQTRRLSAAVRDGTISPPELSGGTFSVSNLGMFGVDAFTAVINPPQAAILAVGSLKQRATVRAGELLAVHTMHVTLTCDHRILYGADAAGFLASMRELLEQPLALLV